MKIDETTKIVSLVSVIVGLMISIAGYFGTQRLSALNEGIDKLKQTDMAMDVSEKMELKAAHISVEFATPLAREFADNYSNTMPKKLPIIIPDQIRNEFLTVIPAWEGRIGLMTGSSCEGDGLKNRAVVTLIIKNTGYADAVNVEIKAKIKASPIKDPRGKWQEFPDNKQLGYADLWPAKDGWSLVTINLGEIRGRISSDGEGNQIVLASVSGRDGLFGTVLVPLEITWSDNITNKSQPLKINESIISPLRSALKGTEIGHPDCKNIAK